MRGLLALALVVLAACRAPEQAPGGAAGETLPAGSAAREAYWGERGVRLACWAPGEWAAVDQALPVELAITNHGREPLVLVLSRRTAWWPFGHRESAQGVVDVMRRGPVIGLGSRSAEERREVPLPDGELRVEPGEEVRLELEVPAKPQRWRPYQEISLRASLYPLAVHYGEEPERFVALAFPELRVQLAPSQVLEESELGDWTAFDRCLEGRPEDVLAYALRYAELDRIRVTDQLISALPGPSTPHRAALLAALSEITAQAHGDHVERWRSWWASREGTRWAMEMRRASGASPAAPER